MPQLVVLLALLIVALAWLIRQARNDGGPRPAPRRHQDEWSSDLPSHPYTHKIQP
ncbi:hypothetical protein [Phytoactinopolyspora halotolerans]|uniref:Uncharacterized protein n=1 Tax=Phytoactinopolyspora halotolerans TaxID=1981512 RepID=A0A6L9SBQ2_9ACTN|nr:hypothetical protein [Phytoactinopolyspora halotolerans]NEE02557.1 hypothetical protein [Phytoactinopolyspora halotolerans]